MVSKVHLLAGVVPSAPKTMNVKLQQYKLLLLGIVFHLVYMWSIFDIYFRSPLVHGMTPIAVDDPPPAKRLVLFVADGLRPDKLFSFDETGEPLAPYLRNVIKTEGSWGISHTRVPTESRPGHVAIIAGFYEDVSAVTKGWKVNPVNFDSVFNQSRKTWSFGSPDILPMFAHGASDPNKVEMFMYSEHDENFATDGSSLDVWVFDRFKELLEKGKLDPELGQLLREEKIVFFLHLLGLDTNGHAFRPYSKEYLNNIKLVDKGIQNVAKLIHEFYQDEATSFVFTADHGMGDRGAHGDGDPDNTRTPLIAWGAGVQKPNTKSPTGHDSYSEPWKLQEFQRNDVRQADIAPLMSSLIGINYPVNSVGVLPLKYLKNTPQFLAKSAFTNSKVVLSQLLVKGDHKRQQEVFFKPFDKLSNQTHHYSIVTKKIETFINEGAYEKAEQLSLQLLELCLEGLRYYQTYDWFLLRTVISAGYLGWIAYSLIHVVKLYACSEPKAAQNSGVINLFAIVFSITVVLYLNIKHASPMYYLYFAPPIFFWKNVYEERHYITAKFSQLHRNGEKLNMFSILVFYLISLEVLVFSYFRRDVLSLCFACMILWLYNRTKGIQKPNFKIIFLFWVAASIATSYFLFLPVEKGDDPVLINIGGGLIIFTGILFYYFSDKLTLANSLQEISQIKKELFFQTVLVVLSLVIYNDTHEKLKDKLGLPRLNQILCWAVCGLSTAFPFLQVGNMQHYIRRLAVVYLAFAPTFLILSISYEVLFYFFFSASLFLWMLVERALFEVKEKEVPPVEIKQNGEEWQTQSPTFYRKLTMEDTRKALFFLFFINLAFFGTGNVASLGSFSLQSVYRLVTVFDPFLMGALLIYKILIPFFIVSSVFGVLHHSLDLPPFSLFLIVLSTTDVMTLNFFFLVRDDGSWLEIGTSISHFIIASSFILFTIFMFLMSHLLVSKVISRQQSNKPKYT